MNDLPYILIADDDEDDIELVTRAFRKNNFSPKLHTVKDGLEAVKYLEECMSLPLAVILDLNMPKQNGLEVLKFIKTSSRFSALPVHILTTSNSPSDISNCNSAGCNGYHTKPVSTDAFEPIITKIQATLPSIR